ncbi:hypothetical protein M9H77_08164 [Catharanthus roseus]|uniref:Uncharacterized protein n=1 Tax=Catharanthus roseus TaxID=4058 RepID=A0ACC0BX76_CATRO|nr:hypothetical protein M9H77_08164 [Catharanthus roseus]
MLYGGLAALWRARRGLKLVGLRADLVGAPRICSLVWPVIWRVWFPTVTLHVLLNSGVEAALMCHDLLRLPSCARTPHVGSSIKITKAYTYVDSLSIRAHVFLYHVFPRLTQDKQRRSKPLK